MSFVHISPQILLTLKKTPIVYRDILINVLLLRWLSLFDLSGVRTGNVQVLAQPTQSPELFKTIVRVTLLPRSSYIT